MFDFSHPPLNKSVEERRRQNEAASAAIDMLGEIMLSDPRMPESSKIEMRIMLASKKLTDKVTNSFLAFAQPERDPEKREALYPERKEVLEYIQLVSAGIDTFLAAHPAPVMELGNTPDHNI